MDDPDPLSLFLLSSFNGISLGSDFWVLIIILIFLLCSSALVSGAEVAFFSLTPAQRDEVEENQGKSSKYVGFLTKNPKELLAVILVANNFLNVAIVIISSYIFLMFYPHSGGGVDYLRAFIEVAGITFVILLIGEIIPKVYANRNPLKLALLMAAPLYFIRKIPPFSWLTYTLVNGTNFIVRLANKKSIDVSTDDLENAIAITRDENSVTKDDQILQGIVNFGNTDVKQIMRSRVDTVAVEQEISFQELMEVILEAGYSRIPVYKETFDEVVGIIFVKDLLPHLDAPDNFEWNSLIRSPFFVPENKKIDDLLKEFQEMKMHMAVVVDEYGGASGVVTLEDVLEEIVGEITDEFDDEGIVYTKVDENTYLFEGKTPLVDLYKVLDIDGKPFESVKGESDSLAGFLIEHSGKIMLNNESFEFENIKFVVESSDKKRIKMVKVIKQPIVPDED